MGGAASFPRDGEDLDFLTEACRARLEQRRASLHRRLVLEPLGFWEAVELLLGSPDGPRLPAEEGADPSRRGRVPEALFEEVQAEIGRALLREPGVRSLVYLGARRGRGTGCRWSGRWSARRRTSPRGSTCSPGAPR